MISERLLNDSGFSGHFRDHGFASCYGQDEDVCEAPWTAGFRAGIVLNPSGATEPKTGTSERHVGNSFGLLRSPWNMRAEPAVVRSRKSCGRKNDLQFPDCTSFINQQHDFDNFEDYVVNLQVWSLRRCTDTDSGTKRLARHAGHRWSFCSSGGPRRSSATTASAASSTTTTTTTTSPTTTATSPGGRRRGSGGTRAGFNDARGVS